MATILHVDMDAFFAAVEILEDPSLAGRPVIVGGAGRRGVVAAASYEARRFGVRSAMPSSVARRLCPDAVFVPGRHDRYAEVSKQIHQIFHDVTPLVEGIALDEAFLDVTGAHQLFGDGAAIGWQLRERVHTELGLSASVGVASSKLVAKLASEAAKPKASVDGIAPGAGVVVVEPAEELRFLHEKPMEALWGVGPVTAGRLRQLGVATVGDLARLPLETLRSLVGPANGQQLHDLAWARDYRPVEPDRAVQSIGHEETYPWDRHDRGDLHREIVRMSDSVASRLRAAALVGRTVTLKLRYGDFTTITRSQTSVAGIDTAAAIAQAAQSLLDQVPLDGGVRLLGISVANLVRDAPTQLALALTTAAPAGSQPAARGALPGSQPAARGALPGSEAAGSAASKAVDLVRARFGPKAVGPAVLLDS
ncbi:MAG: DNA polymerase IV [Acidimicrobiales bacterium]